MRRHWEATGPPQRRDPPNSDEHELIPLHSFEEAGQPTRGPTTERDGQLGVAQTDEDCEQGEATHPIEAPLPFRCPAQTAAALPHGSPVQATNGVSTA